jgi:D-aminopeptidase
MPPQRLQNEELSPFFMAVIESTEEAINRSLFHAETMTGRDGHTVHALPLEKVESLFLFEKSGFHTSDENR